MPEGGGGACVCKENQQLSPVEYGGLIVKIVIEGGKPGTATILFKTSSSPKVFWESMPEETWENNSFSEMSPSRRPVLSNCM